MSEFKIEKGVPFTRRAAQQTYPFADMEVGDSFVTTRSQSNVIFCAKSFCAIRGLSWRFVSSKQPDGSIRVWRVA
jgi:hypothetical protein